MDNASQQKFIFFGTPDVARDTLIELVEAGWKPELVVSNPDAPRGRKHVMTPSETKAWAEEQDFSIFTPDKLDDEAIETIVELGADYAVVVAYGKILPEKLLQVFPKGVFNVHYSLLPKYRGATPVESALLNDDKETGVTVQKMIYELDAGDIVAAERIEIEDQDTTETLRPRLVKIGAELLLNSLPKYFAGEITSTEQEPAEATFCHKLQKADGELDLSASARDNWNKYRAYKAWPGTFFFKDDKRIKITAAHWDQDQGFVIDRVVPEGKKEMDWQD